MTDDERREKGRLKSQKWRETHPGYATQKTKEMRARDPEYWIRWAKTHRKNTKTAEQRYRMKDPRKYRETQRLAAKASRKDHPERDVIAVLKYRIKKALA